MNKIAILYQAKLPPKVDGIQKPMKPGGYSDSGADLAYELLKNQIDVVTPKNNPDINNDLNWVFPDTKAGIQAALDKGAKIFWLNTVLYSGHVIENYFDRDIEFVGQLPSTVEVYDDKWTTNQLLKKHKIPIPQSLQVSEKNLKTYTLEIDFPLIVKPLRGRGSQGVILVNNKEELDISLNTLLSNKNYGNAVYLEQFLSGQEITITVMPSGSYQLNGVFKTFKRPWCLPAVKRINHENGVAPYNGIVAVMENSMVLSTNELASKQVKLVYQHCVHAAELLDIKSAIRIDCRADNNGNYMLFDLNLKPNMTGPSRPHRSNQDSLTLLAAKDIGWSYFDLLQNMLFTRWQPSASKEIRTNTI